jgi:hypothetical protein
MPLLYACVITSFRFILSCPFIALHQTGFDANVGQVAQFSGQRAHLVGGGFDERRTNAAKGYRLNPNPLSLSAWVRALRSMQCVCSSGAVRTYGSGGWLKITRAMPADRPFVDGLAFMARIKMMLFE